MSKHPVAIDRDTTPGCGSITRLCVEIGALAMIAGLAWSSAVLAQGAVLARSVDPSSVQYFRYQEREATVSADVPDRFFGRYHLDASDTNAPNVSTRIVLNSDGSGTYDNYGRNALIRDFTWGVLVHDGLAEVSHFSGRANYWPGHVATDLPAYVIVLRWADGTYAHSFLFESDGIPGLPGPYDSAFVKE
jgi:hypothetical protein